MIEEAKAIAESLERGVEMAGTWYGLFAQRSTLPNGKTVSFTSFVRVTVAQHGQVLEGSGELGSGERIEVRGHVRDGRFEE